MIARWVDIWSLIVAFCFSYRPDLLEGSKEVWRGVWWHFGTATGVGNIFFHQRFCLLWPGHTDGKRRWTNFVYTQYYWCANFFKVTVNYRIYKYVANHLQKSEDGNPFKWVVCVSNCGVSRGLCKLAVFLGSTWRKTSLCHRRKFTSRWTSSFNTYRTSFVSWGDCSWWRALLTAWRFVEAIRRLCITVDLNRFCFSLEFFFGLWLTWVVGSLESPWW